MMKLQKENFPLKVKDHLVTGEEFTLVLDPEKEMLLTKPQPKTNILSKYYESDDYISHTDSNKGITSFLYQIIKKIALQNKLNLIISLKKDASNVLDIGAGTGDFLKYIKSKNRTVFGIEPNQKARDLAPKGDSCGSEGRPFGLQVFCFISRCFSRRTAN